MDAALLDEAYLRARAIDAPLLPHHIRLVWMRGAELAWKDIAARPEAFAIVGRHQQCDAILASDPAVALRHLLVRAVLLGDGSLALRVFDLKSGFGFHLDDEVERRALVASGPVCMRVGRYALVALPEGPLPDTRPAPEIRGGERVPPTGARRYTTRITTLPPAPELEDIARHVAAAGSGRITLRRGDDWASLDVTDAQLDTGVLVGRADRCEHALRSVLTEAISRTHVLLLREGDAVAAFDLASTQGLYAAGHRVRRVRLPDRGATLRLAETRPVLLDWHPRQAPVASAGPAV